MVDPVLMPEGVAQWRGIVQPNGGPRDCRKFATSQDRCERSGGCLRCRRTQCSTPSGGRSSGESFWSSAGSSLGLHWLASGLVALLLNSLVNPGAFAAGITLLTGVPEVIISCVKAALFGLIAGLVACYRGLTITGGGAKAVGNAVNETVVYAFMALFVINVVVTAIGIRMTTG